MRHPHVSSGGRYPALRTIAVLYLLGAVCVVGLCLWQAIRVIMWGPDETSYLLFGPANTVVERTVAVVCWVAVAFIGLIGMLAIAELIKLFIDIEHNTRMIVRSGAPATAAAGLADGDGALVHEGPAIPFVGGGKLLDGDETAEGALLRGH